MMRRYAGWLIGVLVLLGLIWFLSGSGTASPPPEQSKRDSNSAPGSSVGSHPHVRDPGDTPDDFLARTLADEVVAADGIRGRVLAADGSPIAQAVVYARACASPAMATSDLSARLPQPPLSEVVSNERGEYSLPVPKRSGAYVLDVGAWKDGYAPTMLMDVAIPRAAALDLVMSPGLTITGRAQVAGTQGLHGISLCCMKGGPVRTDTKFVTTADLNFADWKLRPRMSKFSCATATVDEATGEFAFSGLEPGTHKIMCTDPSIIVWPEVLVEAGATDVNVMLATGLSFDVHLDIAKNEPQRQFRCEFNYGVSTSQDRRAIAAAGKGSRMQLTALMPREFLAAGATAGDVWVVSYKIVRDSGEQIAGRKEWIPAKEVCLIEESIAAPGLGTLQVECMYSDGSPLEAMVVSYAAPQSHDVSKIVMQRINAFLWSGAVPPGRWFMRISDASEIGESYAVSTEVVVHPDAVALAPGVRMKSGGELFIHDAGLGDKEEASIVLCGPKYSRQMKLPAAGRVVRHVPSGVWKVRGRDGVERTTTVIDGQRATLEW